MTILYVENINNDCYPDTIWGKRQGSFDTPTYLPYLIVWGQKGNHDKEEGKCKSHIPKKLKAEYTTITYPTWKNLAGSISLQPFNPEDSLSDLLFALRGSVGEGESQRDTTRIVVIFAQYGLDTIRRIDLSSVTAFQAEPFTAVELRKGIEVVKEKKRDLSDRESYELLPVGFVIEEPDTAESAAPPLAGVVHIYPNPAGVAAQVEAETIPPGNYSLEVVSVNGEVHLRQEVQLHEAGGILRTFDVGGLPSGYYIIRLNKDQKLVGTYPIIVTR